MAYPVPTSVFFCSPIYIYELCLTIYFLVISLSSLIEIDYLFWLILHRSEEIFVVIEKEPLSSKLVNKFRLQGEDKSQNIQIYGHIYDFISYD